MSYTGPERRKNRVLKTSNSEYHLRENRVVAVRDTTTRTWQQQHRALGETLVGGILVTDAGSYRINFEGAEVGERLCFSNDLMTTPLREVARPSVETVDSYPISALH
jgi:hypothetical protein